MAGELKFVGNPTIHQGVTVTVNIYNSDGTLATSNVSLSEINNNAIFIGDMPILSADKYILRFYINGEFVANSEIDWDGTKEFDLLLMIKELYKLQGLDKLDPMTVDRINGIRSTGNISLQLLGNENLTVVTRQ